MHVKTTRSKGRPDSKVTKELKTLQQGPGKAGRFELVFLEQMLTL